MITEQPSWIIRHANLGKDERDVAPVFASWRNSYWDGWAHNKGIDRKLFATEFDLVMDSIVRDRKDVVTLVACDPESQDHLFSWMCAELCEDLIIHFAYTFEAFRKFGIATALLARFVEEYPGKKLVASHRTVVSKRLEEKRHVTYNPYRKYR